MKPKVSNLLLIASIALNFAGAAYAESGLWTGAADATWAGANWSVATVPGTGDTATFNGAGNGNTTINVTGVAVQSILFDSSSAASYTLGTSASEVITLDNTGLVRVGSGVTNNQRVAANLVLGTATAGTYSLLNDGSGSLTFTGGIQGGTGGTAAAKTLTFGGSGNSLVSSIIDKGGASSLILAKTGTGTLTLSNANTYNGATTVTGGGNLKLDFAAGGAPATNIVPATSALTLTGANLVVNGASIPGTSQTFASSTFGAGRSNVSAAPDSGANLPSVALGAVTFNVGSTIRFSGPATIDSVGNVAATSAITTTTAGDAGLKGILGGIGLGRPGATATVGLYDWPSTSLADGTAGTSPYTIIGGSQVTGFYQTTGITTGGNYDYNSAGVNTIGNTGAAATIRFNTPGGTNTITNSAFTFQNMQGILVTPNMGANNAIILGTGNGALSFRRATSSGLSYGVLWQNNPLGFLRMDIPLSAGRQGGQANGLVQAGPGTVTYLATSNYELQTYLNGGFSLVTGNGAFGNQTTASTVNLAGGTIVGNATFAMDNAGVNKRPINLLSAGGGLAATTGNAMSVTGVVSGAVGTGPLVIGIPASAANGNVVGLVPGSGAGTANATALDATGTVVLNAANNYFGGTVIVSGVLNVNGINALGGANYGGLTLSGGTLQYATSFIGNGSGDLTSIGAAGVTFGAAGGNIDTNGNDVTYAGSIGNGSAGGFTKLGLGMLNLAGANNYSGTTTISAGVLSLTNTTGSATGTGPVTLSGGSLSGSGSAAGTVTQSGGTLAPGAAGTTLTVGMLNYNSGALNFTLNGAGPSTSKVNVANATFTATPVITFNGVATVSNGQSYTVFSSTNPIVGAGFLGNIAPTVIGRITLAPSLVGNNIVVNATGAAGNLVWAGGVGGLGGPITGDTTTWNNTQSAGVAGNWNNAGNRDYFFDGDSVTFNDAGTPNYTVNLTTANSPGALTVNSSGNYQFTGPGSITGATGLVKSGSGNLTLSTANTYTGGTTISGGSLTMGASNALPATGAIVVQGTGTLDLGGFSQNLQSISDGGVATGIITSSGSAILSINNSTANTFSGKISGGVGLTKSNIGSVLLSGANTFTGGVLIHGGSVIVGSASALNPTNPNAVSFGANSTGILQLNGISTTISGLTTGSPVGTPVVENANATAATLTVNNAADGIFAGVLQDGTGGGILSLVKKGAGNLTLSGLNTFTGTTGIEEGILTLGASLALQGSTLNYPTALPSGTLSFGSLTTATLGGLSGNKSLDLSNTTPAAVALTVGVNNSSTTYSGVLGGTGSLTKNGTGTFILSGVNTYSGATTTNAGVLELASGGGIFTTSASVNGGMLDINGGTLTSSATTTINVGGAAFGFHLRNGGSATFATIQSGNNDGGLISVEDGTFTATSVVLQRTASFGNGADPTGPASATNGFVVTGGTATVTGALTIGTSNSSASTLVNGGTLNAAGVVTVGNNSASGRWNILEVRSGILTSTEAASGIVISPHPTSPNKAQFLMTGDGVATVEKISFGTLTSAVGSIGRLTLGGGTLYVGSGGMVQDAAPASYTTQINLSGGTLAAKADWSTLLPINLATINVSTIKAADALEAPRNITLKGALTGTGGLDKDGGGTLTLSGAYTYTGNTTVLKGVLNLQRRSFNDAATVAVKTSAAAVLNLDYSGGDLVAGFVIDGDAQPDGVYGSMSNTTLGITKTPAITGNGLLYVNTTIPASPFDSWAFTNGLTAGNNEPNDDPDNDGISNQLEFVLGGLPLVSSTSVLPKLVQDPSDFVFTFTRNDDSEAEIALKFEYGVNLVGWTPVSIKADTASGDPGVTVDEGTPATNPDTITIKVSKGTHTTMFGRLKAVR